MSKKHKQKSQDKSPVVPQRDKIEGFLDIRELQWTDNQKKFIELIQNKETKIVFCKGPAGTAKSLLSVYSALKALNEKKIGEIFYIRNPVESSTHNLGFLKGDLHSKLDPYLQPLMDKLHELLPKSQVERLLKEERVKGLPVGFLRGLSINASYIICDEAQNLSIHDLLLITTRMGRFSKLILIGDIRQSDIKNSGFENVYNLFEDKKSKDKGIHTFKFGADDIMRNNVLAYIIEKFEELSAKTNTRK
jgi:phosphate starvation-inducible PhoH-like protein